MVSNPPRKPKLSYNQESKEFHCCLLCGELLALYRWYPHLYTPPGTKATGFKTMLRKRTRRKVEELRQKISTRTILIATRETEVRNRFFIKWKLLVKNSGRASDWGWWMRCVEGKDRVEKKCQKTLYRRETTWLTHFRALLGTCNWECLQSLRISALTMAILQQLSFPRSKPVLDFTAFHRR